MTLSNHTGQLLEFEIQPDGSVILCVSDPGCDNCAHYVTLTAQEVNDIAGASAVRQARYATAHGAGHWPEPRKTPRLRHICPTADCKHPRHGSAASDTIWHTVTCHVYCKRQVRSNEHDGKMQVLAQLHQSARHANRG